MLPAVFTNIRKYIKCDSVRATGRENGLLGSDIQYWYQLEFFICSPVLTASWFCTSVCTWLHEAPCATSCLSVHMHSCITSPEQAHEHICCRVLMLALYRQHSIPRTASADDAKTTGRRILEEQPRITVPPFLCIA